MIVVGLTLLDLNEEVILEIKNRNKVESVNVFDRRKIRGFKVKCWKYRTLRIKDFNFVKEFEEMEQIRGNK